LKILITGAAGFIGMHTTKKLLERGDNVIGVDNLNDYYDPKLKESRLEILRSYGNFKFIPADIADAGKVDVIFSKENPQRVINLAAQAGVRYSLKNPSVYIQSNMVGFSNVLESSRKYEIEHLVYASSSSVYGANTKTPFNVNDPANHPLSLYAATKKSNELMAHSYSHLYRLPTTGLRYFTVYGPWGRPDMAPWLFTKAIQSGRTIDVYNHGKMKRDFTYIDDVVEATLKVIDSVPRPNPYFSTENPDPASSNSPYKIYNVGNNQPIELMTFIGSIENALNKKASIKFLPIQPGDVVSTYADIDPLIKEFNFSPSQNLDAGIGDWVKWFLARNPID
jgi:UDP-glucuronate 4-epimerase